MAVADSSVEHPIGWAAHSGGAPVQHVRIDHRRADIVVAEELLNGADVVAVLEEVRGEGVTERMARGGFREAGSPDGIFDSALEHGLV